MLERDGRIFDGYGTATASKLEMITDGNAIERLEEVIEMEMEKKMQKQNRPVSSSVKVWRNCIGEAEARRERQDDGEFNSLL